MNNNQNVIIKGIPSDIKPEIRGAFTARLNTAVSKLLKSTKLNELNLAISYPHNQVSNSQKNSSEKSTTSAEKQALNEELPKEERAKRYRSEPPLYSLEQLILADQIQQDLFEAIDAVEVDETVFEKWGLKRIDPYPRTILNFWGPPGTGKTLAAHAIAARLGIPIICASYAEIESMFHGVGPQNLEALFYAAERDKALLFIDEADSLLSRRLSDVNTGSEQAVNSMRSQLLICVQKFKGIVIFATNLVENYDKAFRSRVYSIHFPLPDEHCRKQIWRKLLEQHLPLAADVEIDDLSSVEASGREIKDAIIKSARKAALRAISEGKSPEQGIVTMEDLSQSLGQIKDSQNYRVAE